MDRCPNCGNPVSEQDEVCPNCGFNLKKFREDFFENKPVEKVSRKEYRKEVKSDTPTPNTIVKRMLKWIHTNSTIVFVLAFVLLVIMSFSRSLGWIGFVALLIWLYIVCDRNEKIERYTVDRKLSESIDHTGTKLFSSLEHGSSRLHAESKKFQESHPKVEERVETVKKVRTHRFTYIQLSIVLMAFINFVVFFSGSGSTINHNMYIEKISVSRVLLNLAGRYLSSGKTITNALMCYVIWLLLVIFPIIIIYNIFKNTKKGQIISFVLSLIETVFLIYIIFAISSSTRANVGVLKPITGQLIAYATSIGAALYFLVLSSVMTTGLSGYNLFKRKKAIPEA